MKKTMPKEGGNYNHTYGNYLKFFKDLEPGDECDNVPTSWVPLILYLGGSVVNAKVCFKQDLWCKTAHEMKYQFLSLYDTPVLLRQWIEFHCTLRPELTDALWKCDAQWHKSPELNSNGQEHLITSYNSFYRPDLMTFRGVLERYKSKHNKAVLTNCFADKPYPHAVHKEIMQRYPDHELLVVTGVLGVVPSSLFESMPSYDSGIPNFSIVRDVGTKFFRNNPYEEVHVFTDFYQQAIVPVLFNVLPGSKITFEFPYQPMSDYLLDESYFQKSAL